MDDQQIVDALSSFNIPKTHVTVGLSNFISSNNQVRSLFINRRLPDHGWSDFQIQQLLLNLSTLDTNNKYPCTSTSTSNGDNNNARWCGVGEREGRVYSSLVQQRHYGLAHGIGRSGDICEPQPKAVGSTILAKLTLVLVMDALRRCCGLNSNSKLNNNGPASHGILLPLCTGMSVSLVLSSLRCSSCSSSNSNSSSSSSDNTNKSIVLWCRIDQKSCYKAVITAGLQCVVIPTCLENGDEVRTDLDALSEALEIRAGRVLAVITTTSCFVPRVPDKIDEVAKLCQQHNVYHIINNAYGLQCAKTSKLINRACTIGRVDAIVSSTDKNFLVPVGGAIVYSPSSSIIQNIGKVYAGRASSSPITDLFITLLSMGYNGYKRVLDQRTRLVETFPKRLEEVATKHGERILRCPNNTISYGITLDKLITIDDSKDGETDKDDNKSRDISEFGSMLFSRCVSGTRVVVRGITKTLGQDEMFRGFGSSTDNYPHSYMTAACAIGLSSQEMDEFMNRLDKTFVQYYKKKKKKQHQQAAEKEEIVNNKKDQEQPTVG